MLNWFLRSLGGYLGLIFRSFLPQRDGFVPLRPRRILVLLAFIPAFLLMQLVHWIGFLLDEVFFPAYRRVEVKAPLFVLGVPRSGTTLLHRTLAEDEQFTTFQTWECLFALSVTARKFWLAIGAFDHCIGQPLTRALKVAERCLLGSMDGVHYTALRSPEEDYFALTPILGCFILVLPFPFLNAVWRMSDFQHAVPETERRRIMAFYRLCLQKHLYVHGPHRRLLSKNAAFASFTQALQENFPDARFIACLRDPLEVVPSQLSAIRPGLSAFGVPYSDALKERFIAYLARSYECLLQNLPGKVSELHVFMTMRTLERDLAGSVRSVYRQLGIPLTPQFARQLKKCAEGAKRPRPPHRYMLVELGLNRDEIVRRFADVYRCYDFSDSEIKRLGLDAERGASPTAMSRIV